MHGLKEIKAFSKAQASAFIGGIIDYLVMLSCVEIFGLHYISGIVIGGCIGAVVNFSINKFWSFKGHPVNPYSQLTKFTLVVLGSIILKSGGTTFFTEILNIDYRISRLITDILVSFGFNYTLQRFWVFGRQVTG